MGPSTIEIIATVLFALAVIHTFFVKRFEHASHQYPEGSVRANFFHLLGEVEAVFGIWAGLLVVAWMALKGVKAPVHYLESLNFTEPVFVFVIMAIAATRPVIHLGEALIRGVSRIVPFAPVTSFFVAALIIGPLMGSFITEPAAMTVTALILRQEFYDKGISDRFKYGILAALFVNVSIGGTLTHFAAPPVLMVAGTWNWDMPFMMAHFGWKAAVAVVINTVGLAFLFRDELRGMELGARSAEAESAARAADARTPYWLTALHIVFLAIVVASAHHMVIFLGAFLFFLGITAISQKHQDDLQLREALLVGFFLGGLVTLGGLQKWWLQPILSSLSEIPLFLGATALTGITDNAALTYLGSQVEGLTDAMKYALVAGAVAGGGLTVIANAPNPAGFGILKGSFGEDGISPVGLLTYALAPTAVAMLAFWFLPSF